ncbi:cell division protein FtsQ [Bacteroidia bacterium]|nr:cell division protein FtsQ [Bacteroidia bacterium]
MIKKIAIIGVVLVLAAYLIHAVVVLSRQTEAEQTCSELQIEIQSTSANNYLSEKNILKILTDQQLNPIGQTGQNIRTNAIEKTLEANPFIADAEVYKTLNGKVKIKITPRTPVLRVITETENYYVDDRGTIMPIPPDFGAFVPVATGNVKKSYAMRELYKFVVYLQNNNFWNNQIEQINVLHNMDVELIPKKGDHIILLGEIANYQENLDKLQLFYEKGLNEVGWNRYSMINLKYKNQVVCTKKEKKTI